MDKKEKPAVTIIRRSCLTGVPVWVYRGPSVAAARQMYWRACKREIERVRNWPELMRKRRERILCQLDAVTAALPITHQLSDEQRQAVRALQAEARKEPERESEFYRHIMEERRRREEDHQIRLRMRQRDAERKIKANRDYDK